MATFSCPRCLKPINYIPPPAFCVIWVGTDTDYIVSHNIASELSKELGIRLIKFIEVDCPHCNSPIVIFLAKKDNSCSSDSDDFSMEI